MKQTAVKHLCTLVVYIDPKSHGRFEICPLLREYEMYRYFEGWILFLPLSGFVIYIFGH